LRLALIFVLAVLGPSLVLAWLAIRSLRDQEFVIERQQSLLYQQVADARVAEINSHLADLQREFSSHVENLAGSNPNKAAAIFDEQLRKVWPLAEVGFMVSLDGQISSPSLFSRPEARQFRLENDRFLCSRESVEVYWNGQNSIAQNGRMPPGGDASQTVKNSPQSKTENRSVVPQQQQIASIPQQPNAQDEQASKLSATAAEFSQLVSSGNEGTVARFLQNKLQLMFWCRPRPLKSGQPPFNNQALVFGAQINLDHLIRHIQGFAKLEPTLAQEICIAFLDDKAHPIALSSPNFKTNWKQPFVASEIGEALPHWEVAVYLLDPAKLSHVAQTAKLTLGLLIAVLLLAIGVGSWLIVHSLNKEIVLARQKTDFVSNVSHELKTPLTSIRMFSELLAEGRVTDPAKQRSYLNIITAETARLARLINNVLDFSHMDRGEKKYNFQSCDLVALARETAESYQPHLEAGGFKFETVLPEKSFFVRGDCDALAQVLVNLISNAEKYSNGAREITLQFSEANDSVLEVQVLDRGSGVPAGAEEKIFEQFYRAHDSLSSGIQGSGLGLTLARQIARAHGGNVIYKRRDAGGSCFTLRLPKTEK